MKPQRLLGRLFRRNKAAAKPAPPKTEAEKARELERTIRGVLRIKVGNRVMAAMGERVIYSFAKDAMDKEARIMGRLLRERY